MQILKNILAGIGLICISVLFIFAMQKAPSDGNLGKGWMAEHVLAVDETVFADRVTWRDGR